MRLALIDLGTNAVRFDVHDLEPGVPPRRLHRERLAVRLGEDVFETGRLSPAAVRRALAAFQSFARTCRDMRVEKITAFGTSALREATNADGVVNLLRRRTGIGVRIITGVEEARLIAEGILHGEELPGGLFAIVDIGGGSVEIALCLNRSLRRAVSVDLGVLRLQQTFLKTYPPDPEALHSLRHHVRGVLKAVASRGGWPRVERIIGSGGTVRVLEKIWESSGSGGRFNAKDLVRMTKRLAPLSLPRLIRVPGMEAKRAEFILAGAVVLEEVSRALRPRRIRSTDFALRDGMLEEETRLLDRSGGGLPSGFDPRVLAELAGRFGGDRGRVMRAGELAGDMFDRFRAVHGLPPPWRPRLTAAALLRDVGKAINHVHSERHSAYVVLNTDVPFPSPWEREFVAHLCLWHKRGKVMPSEVPFWRDAVRWGAFLKLLALLRLVEALDHGRSTPSLRGVRRQGRRAVLLLRGTDELEFLRLDQKKDLFEKTFRLSLHARRA